MIDHYDWAGGREAMLRFGPAHGPVMVAAMPLLEEWNRTRAFTVGLLRALAGRGVASVLPDLPGHGESLVPVGELTVDRLSDAVATVTNAVHAEGRVTIGLALRSGALLDGRSRHAARWHLSPTTGAEMLADLHRVWLAGEGADARDRSLSSLIDNPNGGVIAGTPLSPTFLRSLDDATPVDLPDVPRRVVRLATDPRPADRHVEGVPFWRRAEPGDDRALAEMLADDIAGWIETCVG